MTINSRRLTREAAERDLSILIECIPWEKLSREERYVMDAALDKLYEIMKENEEP